MCTVTVHRSTGLQTADQASQILTITMNRDERRDRGPERQPAIQFDSQNQAYAIYPLDSEAGGTWFGVNKHGICLSLLNRYDAIDYVAKRSRGLLIPELLVYESIQAVKLALVSADLNDYAPFTLMMNTADKCEVAEWTGREFILQHRIASEYIHISSSSWQGAEVLSWRQQAFEQWLDKGALHDEHDLPLYNLYQPAGKAEYAPLVSREQAFTKSITQYRCQSNQIVSQYWNEEALPDGKPVRLTMPIHTV